MAITGLNLTPRADDPLTDFRNFLYLVWKHLALPNPTPVQYDIALFLQGQEKRIIIEAFRGVGKSWVTSAFVCWLLYMNPLLNILVVSATKGRSDDFTTFTMRLIQEMPELAHLIPKDGQRNSKLAFDVAPAKASHAPSVKSVGITGQLAGSRADVIVADDIEIPNNSATQMMRDKLGEAVKEFDAVLKPGGKIIYLGTPQTEMSLYNTLPERGYVTRIWSARFPDKSRRKNYGGTLAPYLAALLDADPKLVGKPTDPQRFSDIDLIERELSYGRSGFALQFMLDTRLSDQERYPLKVEDLIIMNTNPDDAPEKIIWAAGSDTVLDHLPNVAFAGDNFHKPMQLQGEWIGYTGSVMSIDPSGRGKDELGYAVVKFLNGFLYVRRCGGLKGGYDEATLETLANIAKDEKVNLIVSESNFGDGLFDALLRPVLRKIYPVAIEEVRHSKQKELRIIDTLEPIMNQHRLVIDERVVKDDYESTRDYSPDQALKYQLIHQLTRITKARGALGQDDRLDALSIACNYWVEQMSKDADEAMLSRQEDVLQAELQSMRVSISQGNTILTGAFPDEYDGGSMF